MSWADAPGSHYVTQPYMFLMDMSIHHFDMMRYVLGADPVSVQCTSWNQPWGWHKGDAAHAIVFRYEDGLVATHVACGCAVGSQTNWNGDWRIEGPKGSIDWSTNGIRHASNSPEWCITTSSHCGKIFRLAPRNSGTSVWTASS